MPSDDPIPLSDEVNELIRLLKQEAERAREMILNPPGNGERQKAFASSRAAHLLAQFEKRLKALEVQAVNVASKEIRKSYQEGLKYAEQLAKDAGVHKGPIKGSFAQVDTRRAEVLVRQTANDIGNAVRSMGKTTRTIVRKIQAEGLNDTDINRLLAGETLSGRAPEVLREIREMCKKVAVDVDGKSKVMTVNTRNGEVHYHDPEDYADLVFQTKSAEAANIATLERLQQKKLFYVKVIGSNSLNFCTEFRDKVYYIGPGEDPLGIYPHIRVLPRGGAPFHPRCSKRYVAFIAALATPAQLEASKPTPQSMALHGLDGTAAQKVYRQNHPELAEKFKEAARARIERKKQQDEKARKVALRNAKPVEISATSVVNKSPRTVVRDSIDAAARTHRMPPLSKPVQIVDAVPKNQREQGSYNPAARQIKLNPQGRSPALTSLHELGHHVEKSLFDRMGACAQDKAFSPVWNAIESSDAIKRLRDVQAALPGDKEIDYLLKPQEIFARTYSQWVAKMQPSDQLIADLEVRKQTQWDSVEFEKISREFTKFMRKRGLLK